MTQALTLSLDFAALTDIGCSRSNNEDSFGYDADQHIYVVCDGMGGSAAGEVASGIAVRVLIQCFASTASAGESGDGRLEHRLVAAIQEANRAICEAGTSSPELRSMGTTLVCACLEGDRAIIGNVGDSRAYLIRGIRCVQITQDHSLIDEQIRAGNMTPEMAATSDLRSVITRAVGVGELVEPDLFEAPLQPEDLLLLASDGLTRYVSPEEIAQAAANRPELSDVCQHLIEHAKGRGGADNITCILLRAVEVKGSSKSGEIEEASPTL